MAYYTSEFSGEEVDGAIRSVLHKYGNVTLAADGWADDLTQRVTVTGIVQNPTKESVVTVYPVTSALEAIGAANVRPTALEPNTLIFTADSVPTAAVSFVVVLDSTVEV